MMAMDNLPDTFIKPPGNSPRRTATSRPAPFSADEFSTESIEQGSLAYVQHVEQGTSQTTPNEAIEQPAIADEINQAATDASATPRNAGRTRRTAPSQKRPAPTVPNGKANIRLEIAADIRKDMIRIKHKVGITYGVEVSYAAYFTFLHERCRTESGTAGFLADLAQFVEQQKLL